MIHLGLLVVACGLAVSSAAAGGYVERRYRAHRRRLRAAATFGVDRVDAEATRWENARLVAAAGVVARYGQFLSLLLVAASLLSLAVASR